MVMCQILRLYTWFDMIFLDVTGIDMGVQWDTCFYKISELCASLIVHPPPTTSLEFLPLTVEFCKFK